MSKYFYEYELICITGEKEKYKYSPSGWGMNDRRSLKLSIYPDQDHKDTCMLLSFPIIESTQRISEEISKEKEILNTLKKVKKNLCLVDEISGEIIKLEEEIFSITKKISVSTDLSYYKNANEESTNVYVYGYFKIEEGNNE